MQELFFLLWFFLPAGMANMAPVFASKLPILKNWDYPLDGYKSFKGQRIFGDHKTVRGIIAGVALSVATALIQFWLLQKFPGIKNKYFTETFLTLSPIYLGFLLGFGAMAGDAVKSFFKRYLQIPSGKTWFPFDQIDYVIGALALSSLYFRLNLTQYLLIIIAGVVLHILVNVIGYSMGLRKQII